MTASNDHMNADQVPEGVNLDDALALLKRWSTEEGDGAEWEYGDLERAAFGLTKAGARLAEEVQRLKAEREKAIQAVVDACEKHVGHVEAELAAAEARVAELEATIGKYEHVYVMTGTGQSDG